MVSNRKNNNAFPIWTIHNRKRKPFDEDQLGAFCSRRTSFWKGESPGSGFLYLLRKNNRKTRLLFVVINHLRVEFAPCLRDKFCAHPLPIRFASANTSSAAYDGISPRSYAATRCSIS